MKKNIFPIVILTSFLLASCSIPHYYYSSGIQNVPLFKEKNEFSGLAAGSSGIENNFLEIQAGYSFPMNLALMANFMTGGKNSTTSTYTDYLKMNYFEAALGYYRSFKDILVFEVFGGYGHGSQSHVFACNEYMGGSGWSWIQDGDADLSFWKFFIQPDIGIKIKWLEASFSPRLSKLNFEEINIHNTVSHLDELKLLQENRSPWLFEPAFTFRAGGKSIKGEIQFGFSRNLANSGLRFEKTRLGIGLYVNFGMKKTDK